MQPAISFITDFLGTTYQRRSRFVTRPSRRRPTWQPHPDAIDDHEYPLYILAGHHSHDDGVDYDDVIDHDDVSGTLGDYSDGSRHHHDREHLANGSAWQPLDHRVQLDAGRSADQWRGFAALDAEIRAAGWRLFVPTSKRERRNRLAEGDVQSCKPRA
jgi:hypothetical protein